MSIFLSFQLLHVSPPTVCFVSIFPCLFPIYFCFFLVYSIDVGAVTGVLACFQMGFYIVTKGWIFGIGLFENSIKQSLARLPCRNHLERRSSCWRSRKPASRGRRRRGVVSTLSHPVIGRVTAYATRGVGTSGSLHPVEGVDDAGCGVGHTLEKVASRYCTRTTGPPKPPL